jgi:hypothetical protein
VTRSRRNLIVIALLAVAVIAVGSAAATAVGFGGDEDGGSGEDAEGGGEIIEGGPLAGPAAGGATASGAPVALNKPYSWGDTSTARRSRLTSAVRTQRRSGTENVSGGRPQ